MPLQEYRMGAPMERMGVDILGPFPQSDWSNRYVLVAMDYFTKWPEAFAVPDQSTVMMAQVEKLSCWFGAPERSSTATGAEH